MPKRILVIGPSSGLAEEFVLTAPSGWTFEGVGRRSAGPAADRYATHHVVDARDIGPLEYAVRANDCETVVSFLQEGNRRLCQDERPRPSALPSGVAWEVNVVATEAIGRAAVAEHKRVIVVSTDEVFPESGGPARETTTPVGWAENPSWYGGTWAEAEALLGRLGGSIAILRVSALFGWAIGSGCDRRLVGELMQPSGGFSSMIQPTFVADATASLRRLVEDPLSGLFHISVSAPVDRREFAEALGRRVGVSERTPGEVAERHPGLVPGRLTELGVRPRSAAAGLEALSPRAEKD